MPYIGGVNVARDIAPVLGRAAARFPAITLTGPRQSGKSTLCKTLFPALPVANLEEPDVRAFATDDPRGFLGGFRREPCSMRCSGAPRCSPISRE